LHDIELWRRNRAEAPQEHTPRRIQPQVAQVGRPCARLRIRLKARNDSGGWSSPPPLPPISPPPVSPPPVSPPPLSLRPSASGAATGARRAHRLAIVTYRGRAWPLAGRWYATRSDSLHEPRLLELPQCSLDRARAPSERPFPTDHPKGFPAKGPALLNSPPPRGLVGTRAEVPEVSAALGTKNASVH